MKRILIYIEQEYLHDGIDLLETARQIYRDEVYTTYALVLHGDTDALKGTFNVVIDLSGEQLQQYEMRAVCDVISQLQEIYFFDAILFSATSWGRIIAPRVAMTLDTGLVADVTAIDHGEHGLELIRPAYSGRIMASIQVTGDGPMMLSVRPGVFSYTPQEPVVTQIYVPRDLRFRTGGMKEISRKEKHSEYDIRESDVLISGGGGVERYFHELRPLADLLGGHVSASRAIVDKGVADRNIQVGQSGKTVNPRLYIALGINGALQHIEGLRNVEYIISVNTNTYAPICSISDIVVEGDAYTFIHRLIETIQKENDHEGH